MLILSDRLAKRAVSAVAVGHVRKPAIVPQSITVERVNDDFVVVVTQGLISIAITLTPNEAEAIGLALTTNPPLAATEFRGVEPSTWAKAEAAA